MISTKNYLTILIKTIFFTWMTSIWTWWKWKGVRKMAGHVRQQVQKGGLLAKPNSLWGYWNWWQQQSQMEKGTWLQVLVAKMFEWIWILSYYVQFSVPKFGFHFSLYMYIILCTSQCCLKHISSKEGQSAIQTIYFQRLQTLKINKLTLACLVWLCYWSFYFNQFSIFACLFDCVSFFVRISLLTAVVLFIFFLGNTIQVMDPYPLTLMSFTRSIKCEKESI